MADNEHSSYSSGPDIPVEALSQGSMNQHPNFKTTKKEDIKETDGTQFGVGTDGRSKIILPGRYPTKARAVPTTGDKRVTMKGVMTRTDH